MQRMGVQSLVRKLRSHMNVALVKKPKHQTSSIITNSIKAFLMVYIKKKKNVKKKKIQLNLN